jgi:hypothetical protein
MIKRSNEMREERIDGEKIGIKSLSFTETEI